ncbi:TcpE family conjugal transfer membrane protein [Nonomuraea sp. NPDC049400]|uniref:TcpE family conjugal transfer membrane protein n=1 Tax=Nonomuraea sp. NPDC049400 TaxID=3364352 RepID=UPI0037B8BF10
MDLPTYTNIWRIEKRLYKLYDLRLPMPLPIVWIGVFVGVFVPWSLLLVLVGVPVEMPWHVLFLVPPGIVTWLSTRPVIEGKRLTELLESQLRYLGQPKAWYRLAPTSEPETITFSARVWRTMPARAKSKAPRKARQPQRRREGQRIAGPRQVRPAVAAAAAAASQAPVAEPTPSRWGTRRGTAPALKARTRQAAPPPAPGSKSGALRREEALPGGSGRRQEAPRAAAHEGLATEPVALDRSGTTGPGVRERGGAGEPAAVREHGGAGSRERGGMREGAPIARAHVAAQEPPVEARSQEAVQGVGDGSPDEAPTARAAAVPLNAGDDRKAATGKPIDTEALRRLRKLAASADAPPEPAGRPEGERHEDERPEDEVARDQHRKGQPPRLGPALVLPGTKRVWPPLNPDAKPLPRPAVPKHARTEDAPAAADSPATQDPTQPPGAPDVAGVPIGAGSPRQDGEASDARGGVEAPGSGAAGGESERSVARRPGAVPEGLAHDASQSGVPQGIAAVPDDADAQGLAELAEDSDAHGTAELAGDSDAEPLDDGDTQGTTGGRGASRADTADTGDKRVAPAPGTDADRGVAAAGSSGERRAAAPGGDRRTSAPGGDRRASAQGGGRRVPVAGAGGEPMEPAASAGGDRGGSGGDRRDGAGGLVAPVPRPGEGRVRRVESVVGRDSGGWRRIAQVVVGGGGVRTDGSEIDEARARGVFSGSRRVVVLGCTGGAGQSTTALMLGHTFATYRDDRVVAVDASTGGSTMTSKIQPETPETLTSLLSGLDRVSGYLTMRGYTTRTASGLEVISADTDAGAEQRLADRSFFSDHRLGESMRLLDRHYKLAVIDPAPALAARVLPYADQLVLVVPASEEASEAVAMTYEWLDGHGCADLRRRAVMVVNGVSRRSMADVEQAESMARGRCRAIVRVPWEDGLAPDGAEVVDPGQLRAAGRRAYLALAGVVVAGFAAKAQAQTVRPSEEELASDPPGTRIGER